MSGIDSIMLTTDEGSVTVNPDQFDRFVKGVMGRGAKRMTSATATMQGVRVPNVDEFDGAEYIPAPELQAVLSALVEQYDDTIGHLTRVSVMVLWRAKGGKSKGKAKFGQCQKPSGLLAYFAADTEFVITVSADHCREAEYMTSQLRALVYHEALHIGWEDGEDGEDGHAVLVGHDVETFTAEIRDMGAWHQMLSATADAFRQAGLFVDA